MRSYQNATVLAPNMESVLSASCLHLPERQRHRILTHQGSSLLRAVKPIQMSRARWVLVMEQGSSASLYVHFRSRWAQLEVFGACICR